MTGRRPTLRALAIAGVALLTIVVVLIGAGAFVLATEPGARWALDRFAPEALSAGRIEGRVVGPMTLTELSYETEGYEIEIDRLHFDLSASRLLRRTLRVETLQAAGVTVHQRPAADPEPEPDDTAGLPEFDLPLRVELPDVRVRDLRYFGADADSALTVERILARASGSGSDFRIDTLDIRAAAYSLDAAGEFATRGDYPLDLRVGWAADLEGRPEMVGDGTLAGDLANLRIDARLTAPADARLAARVSDLLGDDLSWRAELEIPRVALDSIDPQWPGHAVGAELLASGGREHAEARGTYTALMEDGLEIEGAARVRYADDRVTLDTLLARLPATGGRLTVAGSVALEPERPRFELAGAWSDLAWPPVAEPEYASPAGEFSFEGTAERYRFTLDGRIEGAAGPQAAAGREGAAEPGGAPLPPGRWRLAGTGTSDRVTLDTIRGSTLDGRIAGRAVVSWSPHPSWEAELAGAGLNPAGLAADWPGELEFRLATSGAMPEERLEGRVRLESLSGTLRGEPVEGNGTVAWSGDRDDLDQIQVTADELRLSSGSMELRADGTVVESWDLTWRVDAPDLGDLAPDARGSFSSEGRVTGARREPRVVANVLGDSLAMNDTRVGDLDGDIRVDLSGDRTSSIELAARGIEVGGRAVDAIRIEGQGTLENHDFSVAARAGSDSLDLTFAGGYFDEPGEWRGALDGLSIVAAESTWDLRERAELVLGPDSLRVQEMCVTRPRDEPGAVCLAGDWGRATGGRAELEATELPLALLEPALPPSFDARGELGATARFEIDAEGALTGSARVRSGPGAFAYALVTGDTVSRGYDSLTASLDLDEREIEGRLNLALAEGGGAEGSARISRRPELEGRAIEGRLTAEMPDRGLMSAIQPDLVDTDGVFRADLRAGGTAADPRLSGRIALEDGRAGVVPAGIRLTELELAASSEGARIWELEGRAVSGGELRLTGTLRLPAAGEQPDAPVARGAADGEAAAAPRSDADGRGDGAGQVASADDWAAELSIEGEDFEAYNTPDARVVVTPELRVTAGAERIAIDGEVRVPEASITPTDRPEAVRVSDDVVIVAGALEEPEEDLPVEFRAEVRIVLGDEVMLDASGVTGRLTGELVIEEAPPGPTIARGELQVVEGEYTAYRQTLTIGRGRLIFADGPLRNPGLDLGVSREVDEITVGLDIAGTAEQPIATLWSDPALPKAEALSYLVLGRPLGEAGQGDGEVLQRAATSAGIAGGNLLAARIGAAFGLEEASIEWGEDDGEGLDDASLILGTYLSPRLYVTYTIGLFEATNVLTLRYEINRYLTLQTETGFETAADLLYTVGR